MNKQVTWAPLPKSYTREKLLKKLLKEKKIEKRLRKTSKKKT